MSDIISSKLYTRAACEPAQAELGAPDPTPEEALAAIARSILPIVDDFDEQTKREVLLNGWMAGSGYLEE